MKVDWRRLGKSYVFGSYFVALPFLTEHLEVVGFILAPLMVPLGIAFLYGNPEMPASPSGIFLVSLMCVVPMIAFWGVLNPKTQRKFSWWPVVLLALDGIAYLCLRLSYG